MKITDYFPSPSCSDRDGSVASGSQGQTMLQDGNTGPLSFQTPKKRKVRFTDPELHALVDTILKHINPLFGPKAANAAGKHGIWDEVVKSVNKEGEITRTLAECKKRWQDYKRRVKTIIDTTETSQTGNVPMAEILTKRQMNVAQFFKWDKEGTNCTQLPNDSFLDKDATWDSEDDFILDEKEEMSPSDCVIVNPAEDVCVPHSSVDVPQSSYDPYSIKTFKETIQSSGDVSKEPIKYHRAKTSKKSIQSSTDVSKPPEPQKAKIPEEIIEPTSTELPQQQLPNWASKVEQLIAQQQQTNEMLKIVQGSVSESLKLQKRISQMLKTNFLELQKSIISSQKTSSEQSRTLEYTMKSLHATMNEINHQLRVKQLQELMSTDESDLDIGTPRMLSSSLVKESTPVRKRKLDQSPSSSGSLKKKGRKNNPLNATQIH